MANKPSVSLLRLDGQRQLISYSQAKRLVAAMWATWASRQEIAEVAPLTQLELSKSTILHGIPTTPPPPWVDCWLTHGAPVIPRYGEFGFSGDSPPDFWRPSHGGWTASEMALQYMSENPDARIG